MTSGIQYLSFSLSAIPDIHLFPHHPYSRLSRVRRQQRIHSLLRFYRG